MTEEIIKIRERAKIHEAWCLPPDTLVFTPWGLKEIGDLQYGDLVLADDGSFTKVKAVLQRPYHGRLIELRTGFVRRRILITPDHYVLAIPNLRVMQKDVWRKKLLNGELHLSFKWKKACELDTTDFLVIPCPKNVGNLPEQLDLRKFSKRKLVVIDDTYAFHKYDHFKREFKYKIELNEEFYELLGLYLAEGWIAEHKTSAHVYFALGKHETDLAEHISKLVESIFDEELHWCNHRTCIQLIISNSTIADFFKVFGRRSEDKGIPPPLLPLCDERAMSLVCGYIKGDGCVHSEVPYINMSTSSPMLAGQLYLILISQGILPSIDIIEPSTTFSPSLRRFLVGRHKHYNIVISGEYCDKFPFNIRKRKAHKGMRGIVYNGFALIPIYEITEREYDGIVYNLTTDSNTYTILGGVVHNCQIKHVLCAEEHGIETIQKLAREMNEALDRGDKDIATLKLNQIQELALLTDELRRIRQELVDMIFTFISEEKIRELKGGEVNVHKEKEEIRVKGSGEDCGEEIQLFEEYKAEE